MMLTPSLLLEQLPDVRRVAVDNCVSPRCFTSITSQSEAAFIVMDSLGETVLNECNHSHAKPRFRVKNTPC